MFTNAFGTRAAIAAACTIALGTAYAGGPTTHNVSLGLASFTPNALTIEVGDTVHFSWDSFMPHDVVQTVAPGSCMHAPGGFMSGAFPGDLDGQGTVWEITFDEAFLAANPVPDNLYPYMCHEHCIFGMVGTITVNVPAPVCEEDLTASGSVGVGDLLELLGAWGENPGHPADLTGDGNVGVADLLQLLGAWGPCPE